MLRRFCSSSLAVVVVVIATGCGGPGESIESIAEARAAASPGRVSLAQGKCSFDLPSDVSAVRAHADGLVLARDGVVHRMHGAGCDLERSGAPVAAEALLDVDDNGVLYVFPAEGEAQGDGATISTISTMLPGEYPESMVARVEADASSIEEVTKLIDAGRGIWGFAVAPAGDALWAMGCGPTGFYEVTSPTTVASSSTLSAPAGASDTPPVFTRGDTFWSVGPWTCDPAVRSPNDPAQLTDACGYALVRTTPQGSTDVASTVIDFGAGRGFERGALARCGTNVCGVFASAVVMWSDDGDMIEVLDHVAIDVWRDEHIAGVTGNAHGLYVHLRKGDDGDDGDGGDDGNDAGRVVFIPHGG